MLYPLPLLNLLTELPILRAKTSFYDGFVILSPACEVVTILIY